MIKAIIFDYSDVLGEGVIPDLMKSYPEVKDDIRALFIETFDYGQVDRAGMIKMIAEVANTSSDTIQNQLTEIAKTLVSNHELLKMVLDLKQTYKIGLLSNTGPGLVESNFPEWADRHKYFDDIVFSCDVHMVKPDRRIYELAAKNLGATPSECVFVDDSQKNVDGAEAAGMKGIVYTDMKSFTTELRDALGT